MKHDPSHNPPLAPATLHILLALAAEDLHGYGIIQEIARQSHGHYKLGPGTLYDNLKRLMDQRLVIDAPKSSLSDDETRRLYRLTAQGRTVLSAEIDRLHNVVREARLTLNEKRPRRV
jgi:DNA-binding PadR family transcriptional regulator